MLDLIEPCYLSISNHAAKEARRVLDKLRRQGGGYTRLMWSYPKESGIDLGQVKEDVA